MTEERGEEKRFGLSYSILQARDLSFLDPLQRCTPKLLSGLQVASI